jgi:spermidine synthase
MEGSNRYLTAVVFVVGAACLGAEIAAARLMAPYFGASTIVWANTIAVVLVSLAIGYFVGGRLADRHHALDGLCKLVAGAAVLIAVIPFAARPFFSVSADALDSISAGAFIGSLLGVLVLIAVPVILLGACSPYALRLALTDVQHSGEIAGRLYAVSTAGSLVGTMLAALLLIPALGTQRTFLTFAIALAVVAVPGLGRRYLIAPIALIAMLAIPTGLVKAGATDGGEVIWEGETTQQYVRVVEQEDGSRELELNEGQAIHSFYRPGAYLTNDYWDSLLTLPFASRTDAPLRMAILGNAAGTTARAYGHFFPETEIDAVEIDPKLTELGRRYFGLENSRMTTHDGEDARPWLRGAEGGYDLIMVDAYRQPYIPFYLATKEFFELVEDRLAPGGMVVVNVGHPEGNDDLERVLGATMAEPFSNVMRDPIEDSNTLLIGSDAPVSAEHLRSQIRRLDPQLRQAAVKDAFHLEPRLPGGEVYTDDRAPVEWLIDKSIIGYAQDGG